MCLYLFRRHICITHNDDLISERPKRLLVTALIEPVTRQNLGALRPQGRHGQAGQNGIEPGKAHQRRNAQPRANLFGAVLPLHLR